MMMHAIAGAGLLTGILGIFLNWRQRSAERHSSGRLRVETERAYEECSRRIGEVAESVAILERNAQSNMESLSDGRLAMPAGSRALRMLRSGNAPETTARELGLNKREAELLARVAALAAKS